jgi:hypothetical protein
MLDDGAAAPGGDGLEEKAVTLCSLVGAGDHEKVVGIAIDRMCVRGGGLGGGREGLAVEVYQRLIRRIMAEGGGGIEQALVGEHGLPQDQAKRVAGVLAARSGDIRCALFFLPALTTRSPLRRFQGRGSMGAGIHIFSPSLPNHKLKLAPHRCRNALCDDAARISGTHLKDVDWRVKAVMGSSQASSLRQPLAELALYVEAADGHDSHSSPPLPFLPSFPPPPLLLHVLNPRVPLSPSRHL